MKELKQALKLSFILLIIFGGLYPLAIWLAGRAMPTNAEGLPIQVNGKTVGYKNIGQQFTEDKYFWGRPSAVAYNASSSGGSNLGPSNPEYIALVKSRLDTFVIHNPGVKVAEVPIDLLTASGSGLDPHISPKAARIQLGRIARIRQIPIERLTSIVESHIETPFLGLFGVARVNVLDLNIALDTLR